MNSSMMGCELCTNSGKIMQAIHREKKRENNAEIKAFS